MPASSPTLPYPVEFFIAALVNDTTRDERVFDILVKHGLGFHTEDRRVLATVGLYWIDQALEEGIRRGKQQTSGTEAAWNDIAYTWPITTSMAVTAWILFLLSLMCLYHVVTGTKRTIAWLRSDLEVAEAANDALRAKLDIATMLNSSLPSPPGEEDEFAP
jgi:hypothetical protein